MPIATIFVIAAPVPPPHFLNPTTDGVIARRFPLQKMQQPYLMPDRAYYRKFTIASVAQL
jgi:hypothetical protein